MGIVSKSGYYAKEAFKFVLRLLLPFAAGIFFNWLFAFVFLVRWFGEASWRNSLPSLLLFILFLIVFPFVYLWLGRGNALRQGVVALYKSGHQTVEQLISLVTKNAVAGIEKTGFATVFEGNELKNKKGFIQKINDKLPRPIRAILYFLLEEVPIAAALKEISETTKLKTENLPVIQPIVQRRVDEYVEERLVGDAILFFWLLVGANALTMLAVWYFV
jgi:hypothetical protein